MKLGSLSNALIFGFGPFAEKPTAQTAFSDYPFSLGIRRPGMNYRLKFSRRPRSGSGRSCR